MAASRANLRVVLIMVVSVHRHDMRRV